jgi:hypothetical protein
MPKRKLDPLPAAAFQIMLSLADGDLHGYAIMRQVEEQTGGRLRLGAAQELANDPTADVRTSRCADQ